MHFNRTSHEGVCVTFPLLIVKKKKKSGAFYGFRVRTTYHKRILHTTDFNSRSKEESCIPASPRKPKYSLSREFSSFVFFSSWKKCGTKKWKSGLHGKSRQFFPSIAKFSQSHNVPLGLVCATKGFHALRIYVSTRERNPTFLPPVGNQNPLYRGKSVHFPLSTSKMCRTKQHNSGLNIKL